MIALVAVAVGVALTIAALGVILTKAEFRRHEKAMDDIAARKQAILDEHAAWITRTTAILNDSVANGTLDPHRAARYRRFVR